jgi:phosphoribosylformylglycinamidine synthase
LTDKLAGHDISGGLITTLLEMCFADLDLGATINLDGFGEKDLVKILFSENIGIVFQAKNDAIRRRKLQGIEYFKIGKVTNRATLDFRLSAFDFQFDINEYRDTWFETSYLLDRKQSKMGWPKSDSRITRTNLYNTLSQVILRKKTNNRRGQTASESRHYPRERK